MQVNARFDGRTAGQSEILARAAQMQGRSFGDLVEFGGLERESSPSTKGTVGVAAEAYFGMTSDSLPLPDFRAAGIELKTVPLRPREGEITVKERVYITKIDYALLAGEEWDTASVRQKMQRILFVYYNWLPRAPLGDLTVSDVVLWEPDSDLRRTFRSDWTVVRDLVRAGRAEDISESQGVALVAATKGSGGPPNRHQPNSPVLASQRAWALRPALLRSILERERDGRVLAFEVSTALSTGALRGLSRHVGSTIAELETSLGREPTGAKHRAKLVVDAAIASNGGLTSAQLLDHGVDVRAVVVGRSGWPYEALSFPAFRYQELIREDWEGSELLSRLDRFLFVPILAEKGLEALGQGVVQRPFVWAPSESDLSGMAREWMMFRQEVEAGKALTLTPASRTEYIHVRPKGRTGLDTDPAPVVGPVVKKCFWLNRRFVARIMREAVL